MKKIFFAASLAFLALAWAVDADAAASVPSGVTSGGSNGYCFVTTAGKIYRNGSYAFSEETGFAKCAIAPTFGACGIKSDGSAKCENGLTATDVALMEGIDTGSYYSDSPLMAVTGTFGDFKVVNPAGAVQFSVASGTTFGRTSGIGGSWPCYVTDGTAYFYRGGVEYLVTGSVSCTVGGVDGNLWYVALKTDGTLAANAGYVPSGNFDELSGRHHGFTCVRDASNQKPVCFDYYGLQSANLPDFAVRDIIVYGDYNNPYGTRYACAVRMLDNLFGCWNNSQAFTTVFGTPAAGGTPEPPSGGPAGATCRQVTIPNTSTIEWMDPGFFEIPGSSNAFGWSTATSPIPSNCTNSSVIQWAGGVKCGDVGTLTQTAGSDIDRVTVYNYYTGSTLVPDSFTASGTSRSLLIRDDDTGVPIIKFNAMRDGVPYAANVWQFFGVQNPSAFKNWAFEIGADGSSVPVFATGSQATVLYGNGRSSVVLQLNDMAVAPRGMRIGKASGNVVKTQCESATTACEWTQATLTGALACTAIPKNGKIGQCAEIAGACAPTATGSTTPLENAYVTYGPNGEVLSVTPPQQFKNPDGTIRSADIYSCPNTPEGFANWIDCILEVGGNITDLLTEGTAQLTGEGSGSVVGITQQIGRSAGELSLTGVATNGANLADDVFRRTWNESFVGTENSPFRGFGVFALVISVILIIIAVIGAIGLAASKR